MFFFVFAWSSVFKAIISLYTHYCSVTSFHCGGQITESYFVAFLELGGPRFGDWSPSLHVSPFAAFGFVLFNGIYYNMHWGTYAHLARLFFWEYVFVWEYTTIINVFLLYLLGQKLRFFFWQVFLSKQFFLTKLAQHALIYDSYYFIIIPTWISFVLNAFQIAAPYSYSFQIFGASNTQRLIFSPFSLMIFNPWSSFTLTLPYYKYSSFIHLRLFTVFELSFIL